MSESPEARERAAKQTRTIAFGITSGPAIFLVIALFLRAQGKFDDPAEEWHAYMDWIALFLAVYAIAAHVLIPKLPTPKGMDRLGAFQRLLIIRMAMSEGAALMATVAYMLTGRPIALGVAVAMIVFMAVAQFPTRERMDAWMDRHE